MYTIGCDYQLWTIFISISLLITCLQVDFVQHLLGMNTVLSLEIIEVSVVSSWLTFVLLVDIFGTSLYAHFCYILETSTLIAIGERSSEVMVHVFTVVA